MDCLAGTQVKGSQKAKASRPSHRVPAFTLCFPPTTWRENLSQANLAKPRTVEESREPAQRRLQAVAALGWKKSRCPRLSRLLPNG